MVEPLTGSALVLAAAPTMARLVGDGAVKRLTPSDQERIGVLLVDAMYAVSGVPEFEGASKIRHPVKAVRGWNRKRKAKKVTPQTLDILPAGGDIQPQQDLGVVQLEIHDWRIVMARTLSHWAKNPPPEASAAGIPPANSSPEPWANKVVQNFETRLMSSRELVFVLDRLDDADSTRIDRNQLVQLRSIAASLNWIGVVLTAGLLLGAVALLVR
jgi:hypothetical protein